MGPAQLGVVPVGLGLRGFEVGAWCLVGLGL